MAVEGREPMKRRFGFWRRLPPHGMPPRTPTPTAGTETWRKRID